ncbi:MAG TPA: biopolymer transporter ExbD [Myxococcales bacterium]|nr:biopolymer transporter ExbD [Myxococcales bacterium]
MAGQANGNGGMINGINVTPLVDVMLVLLIIFMVTAKLVVAPSTALGVQLPKAASGDAIQAIFSVQLTKQGGTFTDGHALTNDDALSAQARQQLALHPDLRAVIQADGDVPHKRVIHVMDLLSRAHVSNIAFAVDSTP